MEKMKKNRKNGSAAEENGIPANWANPFADLKIDFPKEEPAPPPPPPTPLELKREKLSDEDKALLKAFGGDDVSVGSDDVKAKGGRDGAGAPQPVTRARLSFNIQRKGKGGKTVTLVQGLKELELLEQMELCGKVKNALGCGARFENGVLEIQDDQRQRAQDWFGKQGYRV